MKKIFIDVFEDDQDIIAWQKNHKIDYDFYNILYYAKEKYELRITDMADYFGVKRQTIYNYFKLHTEALPSNVKTQIAEIYGYLTFNEVLRVEKLVQKHEIKSYPILKEALGNETHPGTMPEEYFEIYEVHPGVMHEKEFSLKLAYNFKLLWQNAINPKTKSTNVQKTNQKSSSSSTLMEHITTLNYQNSSVYTQLLLKLLTKKALGDDEDLLLHIMKYQPKSDES